MPFVRPTLQTIVDRVEADITTRLTGSVKLLKRAVLKVLARVLAGVSHTLHGYLQYISLQIILDMADSEFLARHGIAWGIPRIGASFANDGSVRFTGTNGTNIPLGTKLVRADGVEYETTASGNITGGVLTLTAKCNVEGSTGNLVTGAGLLTLSSPIAGVDDSVEVTIAFANGVDLEAEEAWRVRILARIQSPPAGGSEADYIAWAQSRSGVFKAFVFAGNNYLGLGTVGVAIVGFDPNFVPAGGIVTDVQNYLNSVRPVTAAVTAFGVTAGTLDFDISVKPNTAGVQTAIRANLAQMFKDEGRPGGKVLITHIYESITNAGVEDFSITDIELNNVDKPVNADVQLPNYQFPILGVTNWSTLP